MIITKWIRNKAAKIKAAFKEDFTRNSKLTAEQRERKRMRAVSRISFGVMFAAMAAQMFGVTAFAADAGAGADASAAGDHRRTRHRQDDFDPRDPRPV